MARGCTPSSCSHADRSSFRARRRKARHVASSGELFATRACGRGMMHRVRGRVACDVALACGLLATSRLRADLSPPCFGAQKVRDFALTLFSKKWTNNRAICPKGVNRGGEEDHVGCGVASGLYNAWSALCFVYSCRRESPRGQKRGFFVHFSHRMVRDRLVHPAWFDRLAAKSPGWKAGAAVNASCVVRRTLFGEGESALPAIPLRRASRWGRREGRCPVRRRLEREAPRASTRNRQARRSSGAGNDIPCR